MWAHSRARRRSAAPQRQRWRPARGSLPRPRAAHSHPSQHSNRSVQEGLRSWTPSLITQVEYGAREQATKHLNLQHTLNTTATESRTVMPGFDSAQRCKASEHRVGCSTPAQTAWCSRQTGSADAATRSAHVWTPAAHGGPPGLLAPGAKRSLNNATAIVLRGSSKACSALKRSAEHLGSTKKRVPQTQRDPPQRPPGLLCPSAPAHWARILTHGSAARWMCVSASPSGAARALLLGRAAWAARTGLPSHAAGPAGSQALHWNNSACGHPAGTTQGPERLSPLQRCEHLPAQVLSPSRSGPTCGALTVSGVIREPLVYWLGAPKWHGSSRSQGQPGTAQQDSSDRACAPVPRMAMPAALTHLACAPASAAAGSQQFAGGQHMEAGRRCPLQRIPLLLRHLRCAVLSALQAFVPGPVYVYALHLPGCPWQAQAAASSPASGALRLEPWPRACAPLFVLRSCWSCLLLLVRKPLTSC